MEKADGRGIMREPNDVDDAIAIDSDSRSLAESLLPVTEIFSALITITKSPVSMCGV